MVNTNLYRALATVAAIVLVVSGFAGGVAAETGSTDDAIETTASASGPPCSDDGTVAEVGPFHVYREGFFCEPRVDYDEDWEPSDELPTTDAAKPGPCYHIYYQHEVGPVTYTATSSCDHSVDVDEDWRPTTEDANTVPPCATGNEATVGPATAGYDPYCNIYVNVDEDWEPTADEANTIPPCGTGSETTVGPVTAGYDPYCNTYVEVDEDWEPTSTEASSSSAPDCFYIYKEAEAGPVTVTLVSSCQAQVSVDEDWSPTEEPADDSSPSDRPVGCTIKEADNTQEIWWCWFGYTGP